MPFGKKDILDDTGKSRKVNTRLHQDVTGRKLLELLSLCVRMAAIRVAV
jgi:hypothetical protein